jgi:AbrB family looped-hinge helix DNA binding protein
MNESKITAKGQTTLPKAVREALSLETGDRVRYAILDGEVRIRKVRPINRLYGIVEYDGPPVSLEDMQEAIISGACRT